MTVISTKSITGVTSITSPQSDDAVTLHTNDTTQRVSVTTGGMNVTGVVTATSFSGNITGTASGNPTLANGSNNRVITATGANALTGESTLTYDGTTLMNTGGTITAERGAIPSIEAKNSTDTSYARFYCSQTSGSGGYAAFQKLGTNSSAIGGANATQIWCTGDAPLVVGVNDGERLRITGVGSFGINNSDPKYTMHFKNAMSSSPSWIHMEVTGSNTEGGGGGIAFDTSASNNTSNNSLFLATISGERSGSNNGSNSLVFKTSKSGVAGDDGSTGSAPRTAMVINEDRNVGIGTTNADALSGFTHSSGSTLVLNNLGSNSNWNGQIRLGNTGSGYLIDHNASSTTTTTFRNIYGGTNAAALTKIESGLITFGTGTSYTERLRIQSTGQILYSAASGDNQITSKRTNTAGSDGNYFFHLKATDENDNAVGELGFHRDTAADDARFIVKTRNTGGSSQERLRIQSGGDVLIGTQTTAGKLTVDSGTSNTCATFQSSDSGAGINLKDNSARSSIEQNGTTLKISADTGAEHANSDIRLQVDGATKMKIDSDGYVTKTNHPYFHVQASPSITNTPFDNGVKSFSNVRSNNGSHYDNSTGVFTCPVAGFYFFSAGLWSSNSDANNGDTYALLYRRDSSGGGAVQFAGANHHDQWGQLVLAAGYYCAVGDQIYVFYNGSTQGSTPRNYFSGCLIG